MPTALVIESPRSALWRGRPHYSQHMQGGGEKTMSQYQETIDSSNRICPYCEEKYQVEAEDYSENPTVEECEYCGKKFHSHDSFSVDHHADPDCELNGENHKWEPVRIREGHHDFCSVCDKCRPTDR